VSAAKDPKALYQKKRQGNSPETQMTKDTKMEMPFRRGEKKMVQEGDISGNQSQRLVSKRKTEERFGIRGD